MQILQDGPGNKANHGVLIMLWINIPVGKCPEVFHSLPDMFGNYMYTCDHEVKSSLLTGSTLLSFMLGKGLLLISCFSFANRHEECDGFSVSVCASSPAICIFVIVWFHFLTVSLCLHSVFRAIGVRLWHSILITAFMYS